jgi:hypothetical protein
MKEFEAAKYFNLNSTTFFLVSKKHIFQSFLTIQKMKDFLTQESLQYTQLKNTTQLKIELVYKDKV